MVTITQVPPNAAPVELTGFVRPKNFEERMLAFLCHNNRAGFHPSKDDQEISKKVANYLIALAQQVSMTRQEFATHARGVSVLSKKRIKLMRGYELLARLYGYYTWSDCSAAIDLEGYASNLRYGTSNDYGIFETEVDKTQFAQLGGRNRDRLTIRALDRKTWDEFTTDGMSKLLYDFVRQYHLGKVKMNESVIEAIGLKRFFGLKNRIDLVRHMRRHEFPPLFKPINVTKRETNLTTWLAAHCAGKNFSVAEAMEILRDWCIDEDVAAQIHQTLLGMMESGPEGYLYFWFRKYGACGMFISTRNAGHAITLQKQSQAGCAFITVNDRITEVHRMEPKGAKDAKEYLQELALEL